MLNPPPNCESYWRMLVAKSEAEGCWQNLTKITHNYLSDYGFLFKTFQFPANIILFVCFVLFFIDFILLFKTYYHILLFDVYFTIVHNTFAVSLYLLIHLSICKILLQVDLSVHETRAELYPAGEITLPEGSRWIFTHFHQCILCMLCIFVIYIDYFAGREPLDSHSFSFWTTAYFAYFAYRSYWSCVFIIAYFA